MLEENNHRTFQLVAKTGLKHEFTSRLFSWLSLTLPCLLTTLKQYFEMPYPNAKCWGGGVRLGDDLAKVTEQPSHSQKLRSNSVLGLLSPHSTTTSPQSLCSGKTTHESGSMQGQGQRWGMGGHGLYTRSNLTEVPASSNILLFLLNICLREMKEMANLKI